jgi:hypothetical protein
VSRVFTNESADLAAYLERFLAYRNDAIELEVQIIFTSSRHSGGTGEAATIEDSDYVTIQYIAQFRTRLILSTLYFNANKLKALFPVFDHASYLIAWGDIFRILTQHVAGKKHELG